MGRDKQDADNTESADKVGPDQPEVSEDGTDQGLEQLSWDDLEQRSGLSGIGGIDAKIERLERTIIQIHREVKRHHIFKEVLTHLIAMGVALSIERSGADLKDFIRKAPHGAVQVEESLGGIDFIPP